MGYDLSCRCCSGYIGEEAYCYSLERGVALTLHFVWSILQQLLPAFEFVGSSALDQMGLRNLDPLRCLNNKVMKTYMI